MNPASARFLVRGGEQILYCTDRNSALATAKRRSAETGTEYGVYELVAFAAIPPPIQPETRLIELRSPKYKVQFRDPAGNWLDSGVAPGMYDTLESAERVMHMISVVPGSDSMRVTEVFV